MKASCNPRRARAFTLVELLVASVIMVLLIMLLATMVGEVSKTWKRSETQITRFQNARMAFERMSRSLSQATLNPYWDYMNENNERRTTNNASTFQPAKYGRCSDQHFLIAKASEFTPTGKGWACFFQAPLGASTNTNFQKLNNLLNAVGYFAEFNNDADPANLSLKPSFITTPKWRYRLMDLRQPSEDLLVFQTTNSAWVTDTMGAGRQARPISDNVIALVFLAKDDLGNPVSSKTNSYDYDSRDKTSPSTWNQLPAQVLVTMVVIDEPSAARLESMSGTAPPPLVNTSYFSNPAQYAQDLEALKGDLTGHPAKPDFRVFHTTIRIESAKWSQ